MTLSVTILTILPEIFPGPLGHSLMGKALEDKKWKLDVINIRDFGLTKHQNIDDEPYGGGAGMIMRPDVLGEALDFAIKKSGAKKIFYMSPRGKVFNQGLAEELALEENIIILCGRFEGIDERVIDEYNACEISMGDYILSGGEIASMAMLEAVLRLIPGILGNPETLNEESFNENLLEYPLYTRPENWRGRKVPEVLLSGNHAKIDSWRKAESTRITKERRPDLLEY
jgi:tRNA (guanine37-N1)-methyltransferase